MSKNKIKPFKFTARRTDIAHLYSLLRIDWPVAEKVIAKLNALIFTLLPDYDLSSSKLTPIIEAALLDYGKCVHREDSINLCDYERIGAFTNSLLNQVSTLITSEIDSKRVDSLNNEALERLRASIYELLLTESLRGVFEYVGYEKKLLGARGSLSN